MCCCVPVSSGNAPDPTILPIDNLYVLDTYYLKRNRTLHIHCVLPEDRSKSQSPANVYSFVYDVSKELEEDAISFCKELKDQAYKDLKVEKSLLVLINNNAGHKKAKKIFYDEVLPVFKLAKCKVDETSIIGKNTFSGGKFHVLNLRLELTHKGHAMEIAENLDIEKYDAIVTVSGDGVIHEVLNGFLKRPDAAKALKKVPLGVIPGGSGNALNLSLLGEKRGFDAIYAALQVVKGEPLALDVCSVTYDDHRDFSFLSQHFGLAASTEYSSELFGNFRETFGLIPELISLKSYHIKAFLQIEQSGKEEIKSNYVSAFANESRNGKNDSEEEIKFTLPPLSEPAPTDWTEIDDKVSVFLASKVPILAKGLMSHPCALPNDGTLDLLVVRGNAPFKKRMDVSNQLKDGKHLENETVIKKMTTACSIERDLIFLFISRWNISR